MNWQRESRRDKRTRYNAEQHFDALDDDADSHEASLDAFKAETRTKIDQVRKETKEEVHGIRMLLIGALLTTTTATITFTAGILMKAF